MSAIVPTTSRMAVTAAPCRVPYEFCTSLSTGSVHTTLPCSTVSTVMSASCQRTSGEKNTKQKNTKTHGEARTDTTNKHADKGKTTLHHITFQTSVEALCVKKRTEQRIGSLSFCFLDERNRFIVRQTPIQTGP